MNLREARIIARFDYRNLVRSAPGVSFLVLYLMAGVTMGTLLVDLLRIDRLVPKAAHITSGEARAEFNRQIGDAMGRLLGGEADMIRFLVHDRPVLMSGFFLISLLIMPIFVQFLSFNQISGYVSRKSIRYIIPKTGRLELYLGLFASNLLFFTAVSGALTAIMTIGWTLASKDASAGMVVGYSVHILVSVWLACLPIIAFMSMVAAVTGSPVATVFLGAGAYALINVTGYFVAKETPWGRILHYVLPLEAKYWFARPGVGWFLLATLLMLVYTGAYLAIGWIFLRRRNL